MRARTICHNILREMPFKCTNCTTCIESQIDYQEHILSCSLNSRKENAFDAAPKMEPQESSIENGLNSIENGMNF